MLDRVDLLRGLNTLPLRLTGPSRQALTKTLDKALGQMLAGLPLAAARAAPPPVRASVSEALYEALTMAELKKVSKLWEPKRTVAPGVAHSALAADLTDLMEGRREPFEPAKLTLAQARALAGPAKADLLLGIERFATLPQLKTILKKWDKASAADTADRIRTRLLELLRD